MINDATFLLWFFFVLEESYTYYHCLASLRPQRQSSSCAPRRTCRTSQFTMITRLVTLTPACIRLCLHLYSRQPTPWYHYNQVLQSESVAVPEWRWERYNITCIGVVYPEGECNFCRQHIKRCSRKKENQQMKKRNREVKQNIME